MRSYKVETALVTLLMALLPLSGCSLVVDSGQYVARVDAGLEDSGTPEDGSVDVGSLDQGPVFCNNMACELGQFCRDDGQCVECLIDAHCATALCDPTFGLCIPVVPDCSACGPDELCLDHPGGEKACVICDRDQDGFLSALSICEALVPDCNDANDQQYPGAVPICGDGRYQGCAVPELELVRVQQQPTLRELGRLPVRLVSEELAGSAQLSTVAMPGDYLMTGTDDPNAARWVFGFVTSDGEAQVESTQYDYFNVITLQHEWEAIATRMSNRIGWPIDPGKVSGFTVDGSIGSLRYAASGESSPMMGHRIVLVDDALSALNVVADEAQPQGFQPPLAIVGGTNADVFYRDENLGFSGFSRLRSLRSRAATAAWVTVPSESGIILDAEGDLVFYQNSAKQSGDVWDGVASTPNTLTLPPTTGALMTGPARFSRDSVNTSVTGLLPYDSGIRVVRFACTGAGLDNCASASSDVQSFLPGLTHFDFEVLGNLVYVFHTGLRNGSEEIQLSVFLVDFELLLVPLIGPIPFITNADPAVQIISQILSIETAIQMGPAHAEIVVGSAVDRGGTMSLLASGIRGCFLE